MDDIFFNRSGLTNMNIDGYMVDDDGSWCWDTFILLIFINIYIYIYIWYEISSEKESIKKMLDGKWCCLPRKLMVNHQKKCLMDHKRWLMVACSSTYARGLFLGSEKRKWLGQLSRAIGWEWTHRGLIAKDSNFDMLTLLTHNRDCYYGILIIHGLLLWLLLLYIYIMHI